MRTDSVILISITPFSLVSNLGLLFEEILATPLYLVIFWVAEFRNLIDRMFAAKKFVGQLGEFFSGKFAGTREMNLLIPTRIL